MLTLHPPAKVNLFLRVLAREESGYHQLETLFSTLEFQDTLTLERAPVGVSLQVEGASLGPVEENLVYRAAEAFLGEARVGEGVAMRLEKRIPPGAGLGGGSSDAGATLMGLRALFPGTVGMDRLLDMAGDLGADVPFFVSGSPIALGWGRGDRILPLPPLPSVPVLLALPSLEISTPFAYELLANTGESVRSRNPSALFSIGAFSRWEDLATLAHNDFEGPIFQAYPELAEIRSALQESGSLFSLLSGSGSAVFGIFLDDQAAALARDTLSHCYPDARFLLTRTGSRTARSWGPEGLERSVGD